MLIDRGANISAANMDGKTPLHFAARNRREPVARLLIDRGAKVSAVDEDRWTPPCTSPLGIGVRLLSARTGVRSLIMCVLLQPVILINPLTSDQRKGGPIPSKVS